MGTSTKNEEIWVASAALLIGIFVILQDITNSYSWLGGLLFLAYGISASKDLRHFLKPLFERILQLEGDVKKEEIKIETKGPNSPAIGKGGTIIQNFGPSVKVVLDETTLRILKFLNEEFNKNPDEETDNTKLATKIGLELEQLKPHITYLEGKKYIRVTWLLGRKTFYCQITSDGIDALK